MASSNISVARKTPISSATVLPFAQRRAVASRGQQEIIDVLAAALARAQRGKIDGLMLITSNSDRGDQIEACGIFGRRETAAFALTKSLNAVMDHIEEGGCAGYREAPLLSKGLAPPRRSRTAVPLQPS